MARLLMLNIGDAYALAERAGFEHDMVSYVNALAFRKLKRPPQTPIEAAKVAAINMWTGAVFFRDWARQNGQSSEEARRLFVESGLGSTHQ